LSTGYPPAPRTVPVSVELPHRVYPGLPTGIHLSSEAEPPPFTAWRKSTRCCATAGETPLDGATLGEANVRESFGVVVLAVRNGGRWRVAPDGEADLPPGDELFVAGSNDALDRFTGAIA